MKVQAGLEKIRNYFTHVSPNQLYCDLVACGLDNIDSWADVGVELANNSELKAYDAEATKFRFEDNKSYETYRSALAEAA